MVDQKKLSVSKASGLARVSITAIRMWIAEGFLENIVIGDKQLVDEEQLQRVIKARDEHGRTWKEYVTKFKE